MTDTNTKKLKKYHKYLKENFDMNKYGVAVELLLNSYDMYIKATDDINKNGLTIQHLTDNKFETCKANPSVKIQLDAQIQIVKLLVELGLTPKASKDNTDDKVESPLDKFLNG